MSWKSERARVAALSRSRRPDDPELVNARRDLKAERLVALVRRALNEGPELTITQRARVADLVVGDAR